MANAMTALATITLGASQATVTFSSISGAYRDLRLVVVGRTATNLINIQFNADTGANYYWVNMVGDGTNATSTSAGPQTQIQFPNMDSTVNNLLVDILDYSATDKHKTALARMNAPTTSGTVALAGRWASTSAITSLTVSGVGGNVWAIGSTFTLYGIVSA